MSDVRMVTGWDGWMDGRTDACQAQTLGTYHESNRQPQKCFQQNWPVFLSLECAFEFSGILEGPKMMACDSQGLAVLFSQQQPDPCLRALENVARMN